MNYYHDMWERSSHTLLPLTKITPSKLKFKWTKIEEEDFDEIVRIVARDSLLNYLYFNEEFKIYANDSDFQLEVVIKQKGKLIVLYGIKLTDAQRDYIVIERELLSIVENIKVIRTILLGKILRIYTDHKNLTCKHFSTDRLLMWRLILEDYGPDI